ncbi:MAG: hypothetical protein PUJ35_08345 [Ruminococcus bromii]|nr:hypothetical protein [Ruminococcus bromii]
MKKIFSAILACVVIATAFSGCGKLYHRVNDFLTIRDYPFLHPREEIVHIEIGITRSCEASPGEPDLTVETLAVIPEEEWQTLLDRLCTLTCREILIGDPPVLYTDEKVIHIVYENGDYESINDYAQATYKNGRYKRESWNWFDSSEFQALIDQTLAEAEKSP